MSPIYTSGGLISLDDEITIGNPGEAIVVPCTCPTMYVSLDGGGNITDTITLKGYSWTLPADDGKVIEVCGDLCGGSTFWQCDVDWRIWDENPENIWFQLQVLYAADYAGTWDNGKSFYRNRLKLSANSGYDYIWDTFRDANRNLSDEWIIDLGCEACDNTVTDSIGCIDTAASPMSIFDCSWNSAYINGNYTCGNLTVTISEGDNW